jgi:protein-tyrosine phosphatase
MSDLSIMFICTGNICRSPLAHAVMEHLIREEGLEGRIRVESSGTGAWHAGEPADPRMRRTAERHGIRINHRSRQLRRRDLEDFDLLLAMDRGNHRDTVSLSRNGNEGSKVRMFRDFDPEGDGDVPDPWYGGPEGFEEVWRIVERTCRALLPGLKDMLETCA